MSAGERSSAPSLSPSDYLLDINKVLLAMADNELLLNSSELSGGLYEDFSSQEDTLKVGHPSHAQTAISVNTKMICDVVKVTQFSSISTLKELYAAYLVTFVFFPVLVFVFS